MKILTVREVRTGHWWRYGAEILEIQQAAHCPNCLEQKGKRTSFCGAHHFVSYNYWRNAMGGFGLSEEDPPRNVFSTQEEARV